MPECGVDISPQPGGFRQRDADLPVAPALGDPGDRLPRLSEQLVRARLAAAGANGPLEREPERDAPVGGAAPARRLLHRCRVATAVEQAPRAGEKNRLPRDRRLEAVEPLQRFPGQRVHAEVVAELGGHVDRVDIGADGLKREPSGLRCGERLGQLLLRSGIPAMPPGEREADRHVDADIVEPGSAGDVERVRCGGNNGGGVEGDRLDTQGRRPRAREPADLVRRSEELHGRLRGGFRLGDAVE